VTEAVGDDAFFPTLSDALAAYRNENEVGP